MSKNRNKPRREQKKKSAVKGKDARRAADKAVAPVMPPPWERLRPN